jgi:SAM-dependent methyltransferase
VPLAFHGKRADSDFWDAHWENVDTETTVKNLGGSLLARAIEEYLPKEGKILEGGCGLGQWVLYFREKGYDIVGRDFAEDTIERVKARFPDLPVETGNILVLPYLDGHFSAYISLGVVEHFEEGPEAVLEEAHRILKKQGLLLCSVPYFNPLRRSKKRLFSWYHQRKEDEEFYQWAFTKREITAIIEDTGFRIRRIIPFDAVKGIKDEIPGMRKVYRLLRDSSRTTRVKVNQAEEGSKEGNPYLDSQKKAVLKWILESYLIRNLFCHMLLVIAEKRGKRAR